MHKSLLLVALSALSFSAPYAHAEFTPLGDLPSGIFRSAANATNADGSVVVGFGERDVGSEAFRWTATGGMVGLGDLPGGIFLSEAYGINADGSVVVGESSSAAGDEAFRWTAAGGIVGLGDLTGGFFNSRATAANADGSVVVGYGNSASGREAFRWTAAGGMVGLGDLAGSVFNSEANATNADGSVVVGFGISAAGFEAFRWTQAGGMVGLGDLPGGSFFSLATDTNADGSVVVGYGTNAAGDEAFRWTAAGGMVGLGDLAGGVFNSQANATNADGSVVVGYATSGAGFEAFRWTDATGMQTVADWLSDNGVAVAAGFTMESANDISDDGMTIVGQASSSSGAEAFIAHVGGAGSGGAVSLNALADSLADAGLTSVTSISLAGLAINGAHSRPLAYRVSPGRHCGWVAGDWGIDDHGSRDGNVALAEVGACHHFGAVQANVALGKTWADQDMTLSGDVDQDGHYVMAEALVPLTALSRGELWAVVSAFYHWGDADITRGYLNAGLPDTSRGDTDSRTWGVRTRLEWDKAAQLGSTAISPYADLSYTHTKIDGYTETSGGFPAIFDGNEEDTTELRLGLNASKPADAKTTLIGLLEAAHRFDNNGIAVSGTVIGLSTFNFEADNNNGTWLRAGIGVEHKTGNGRASLMLNGTTEGETPTAWITASWQATF